eukprot:1775469-Amphidinium_carterae.1
MFDNYGPSGMRGGVGSLEASASRLGSTLCGLCLTLLRSYIASPTEERKLNLVAQSSQMYKKT